MNDMRKIDLKHVDDIQDITEVEEQEHGRIVVSRNVELNFVRFVKMLKTHDLAEILEEEDVDQNIIIPADLLADISNSEMVIERKAATTNIYSGIFIYGVGVGSLLVVIAAIVLSMTNVVISSRDLMVVGGIMMVGLLLPFAIIASEPVVTEFQSKHRDYLERVTNFLSKR